MILFSSLFELFQVLVVSFIENLADFSIVEQHLVDGVGRTSRRPHVTDPMPLVIFPLADVDVSVRLDQAPILHLLGEPVHEALVDCAVLIEH